MNNPPKLNVVSFIGPSGSGKSTAILALSKKHAILQEKYMELNRHQLDNRLMLSKWAYIQYWFDGVLQSKAATGVNLLLTDRCPLDTCAYVREGRAELLSVLMTATRELGSLNVKMMMILLTAPFDILQGRISLRLKNEPARLNYNEGVIDHNRRAYSFYTENTHLWDRIIDTSTVSELDLPTLCETTIQELL